MNWRKYNIHVILADAFLMVLTFLLASLIRFGEVVFPPFKLLMFAGVIVIILLISLHHQELFYSKYITKTDLIIRIIKAVSITCMLFATLAYFDWTFRLPRTIIILIWIIGIILLSISHLIFQPKQDKKNNILIIGTNKLARKIARTIEKDEDKLLLGYSYSKKNKLMKLPFLGKLDDLRHIIETYKINEVVISLDKKELNTIFNILNICIDLDIKLKVTPNLDYLVISGELSDEGLVTIDVHPRSRFYTLFKEVADIVSATLLLIITSPLILLLAILVKLTSKGPVFYSQDRLAQYNQTFKLYKFRTMIKDAEKHTGKIISKGLDDPRITKLGKFLRRSHLDELPQLASIIAGHMSFVGPRPERPELSKKFNKKVKNWSQRLFVKPGLTGQAQVEGYSGLDPINKLRQDLHYIKNQSLNLDLKILLETISYVLFHEESKK